MQLVLFQSIVFTLLCLSFFPLSSSADDKVAPSSDSGSEQLYSGPMGFTSWPPELTNAGVKKLAKFLKANSNLSVHHLDGGIPWQEALDRVPFSQHLRDDWARRKSGSLKGKPVFLAITPINFSRDGIAAYWGKKDNLPLPSEWRARKFADPEVKLAFTLYALKAIEFFKPDYLAIGIESNIIITKAPEKWDGYLELNKHVYQQIKQQHPQLSVFSTVQYEHLRGREEVSKKNLRFQVPGVKRLMMHSDLLALSTYRYGFVHNKYDEHYFKPALVFNKKIAIAEMGAMSKLTLVLGLPLPASENDQASFINLILGKAAEHNFLFVVNWLAIDFDKMLPQLPKELRGIAKAWVHTGLVDKNGNEKKALSVWKKHLGQK